MALSAEDLEVALATYDKGSAWYKRDILGLRGAGAESIYIGFGSGHILSREEMMQKNFVRMSVGIDVGGRDATVATLVGISAQNELCLIDGYYHKQGTGEYMTHDKYVKEIAEKVLKWTKEYPALEFGGAIFCESAEKMFRTALSLEIKRVGSSMAVHPSYKKDGILDRIRFFCMLINQGRFFVAAHLGEWVEAFYGARWCEGARGRGEWVRVDDGSYGVDCLDSAEYGGIVFKGQLIK